MKITNYSTNISLLFINSTTTPLRIRFCPQWSGTRGNVKLFLLSSGDDILVLDEQLILPPTAEFVLKGHFEAVSYPSTTNTQHWNKRLIPLRCLKAIHSGGE
jgi:hypothetical protein